MRLATRAAVGLSVYVVVDEGVPPSLEAILKFYVDLTKGTLISDDRQIEYLDVQAGPPKSHGQAAGTVFIEFDRLERMRRRFDLASDSRHDADVEPDFGGDTHSDPESDDELEADLLCHGHDRLAEKLVARGPNRRGSRRWFVGRHPRVDLHA